MSINTTNQFRTGGKSEGDRHFRVVSLENKNVSLGGVSISSVASPSDAARKLLKSIAHEKGLEKMKKLNMGKVKFSIQEYTQGSKKKTYGPYVGHYRKYSAEEMKKATTAKGKVKFTMKPVVKLNKSNKVITKKVNKPNNNKSNNNKVNNNKVNNNKSNNNKSNTNKSNNNKSNNNKSNNNSNTNNLKKMKMKKKNNNNLNNTLKKLKNKK
tara:strand:+ start:2429 stop:3061 length:633 start_codon:yes stop_codon:yes gene_type:complete